MVLLSRLDETLVVGEERHDLATSAHPGVVEPRGFESASSFSLDPLPSLSWECSGRTLTRSVARVHQSPATALVYAYEGPGPARLELRPLVAFRDHHALQRENDALDPAARRDGPDVVLQPYAGCAELRLRVPEGEFEADPRWYRRFVYERERERGYDFEEDLFGYGVFRVTLYPGEVATLLAWAGPIPEGAEAVDLLAAERRRLRAVAGGSDFLAELRRAGDAFLVRGEQGCSVIAGYPWASELGRDALIALPGLCLSTRRYEEAREILTTRAGQVEAGMIPGLLPEAGGAPVYDAADAALWLVVAVQRYVDATGDRAFAQGLQEAVFSVIDGCRRGTRHGIRMTPAALLSQGEPGLPLTWMDARAADGAATPRAGEAVELQALWYNALLIGADLAGRAGDAGHAAEWSRLANLARDSFQRAFWSEELGYLADVVSGGTRDFSLRPNQLLAISLPHALLPREKASRVLEAVKRSLLTPAGLRTLAPGAPAYCGHQAADRQAFDAGRHQGGVWPWLMGVYFDAAIRVHGEEGKREAREWLRGFEGHLEEAGLGFVGELFDGDSPHRAGGAIAVAVSVAELLRIATRLAGKPIRAR